MLERAFKFTSKDLVKLAVMLIVATSLFGLPGLLIMLTLQWITQQSYALESSEKHGISRVSASRLGGASIFGFSFILYGLGSYSELFVSDILPRIPAIAWITVIVCMLIGLLDDLKSNFMSPISRLLSKVFIFSLCLSLWTTLIPEGLGVPLLDTFLAIPFLGWFLTLIFCIGFVNAVNMADGANGLMPGTFTIAFLVYYLATESPLYAVLMTTCGLFTIFNIISGRLFLGDAGAYGLGSILLISGLYLYSEEVFSAPFLAVLFAYPCIDLLVTLIRRKIKGSSILIADNEHLHNRIHFHFQHLCRSTTLANSMTGIFIVCGSSGVALLGFTQMWWPVTSNAWIYLFLMQCFAYLIVFVLSNPKRYVSKNINS